MPVVINDFEVLPNTTPAEQKSAADKQQNNGEAKKLNDVELTQMIERLRERYERVRAH